MILGNQNADHEGHGNCANIWNNRKSAEEFWSRTQKNKSRIDEMLDGVPLKPDYKILDIGAGPGSLALPLSEKVDHVTAVEPADGMLDILQENIEYNGIDNIDTVKKRWEDVDVKNDLIGPYDIVISSFALGMPDIKDAIKKMQVASSKYVYIYWFAGQTPWENHSHKLWPLLYGKEYKPRPKCDVLYNVLYNMGIYPDMHVFSLEYQNSFSSIDEAVDYFRSRYTIETENQERLLRDYLGETLEKENGKLVENGCTTRVKIWWEK